MHGVIAGLDGADRNYFSMVGLRALGLGLGLGFQRII